MPTVSRIKGYRFFFCAGDSSGPPHLHIERDNDTVKVWLAPVRLQRSRGFTRKEINSILKIIRENKILVSGKWNEYFRQQD